MSRSEPIAAAERTYIVLLQPEPEGGFTVTCPSLPGLVTHDETRSMAAEAIECYLESLQQDGLPLPESDSGAMTHANVDTARAVLDRVPNTPPMAGDERQSEKSAERDSRNCFSSEPFA